MKLILAVYQDSASICNEKYMYNIEMPEIYKFVIYSQASCTIKFQCFGNRSLCRFHNKDSTVKPVR